MPEGPGRPVPAGRRRSWWWRLAATGLALVVVLLAASLVLVRLDHQVRIPIGARGAGQGPFPVVELAGLHSDGAAFAPLTAALAADGVPVLDFDAEAPGVQPLTWVPASAATHVPQLATDVVGPAVLDALRRGGFDPRRQVVDVVAHSAGGLVARYLVERAAAPPGSLSWAARIDDLVMVATPSGGSQLGFLQATLGPGHQQEDGIADDLRPGSPFLRQLGTREPPGEVYTTVGGDPWMFRWLRYGHHGFDGAVPAESPFLDGAATYTFPQTHGRLLRSRSVVDLARRVTALPAARP